MCLLAYKRKQILAPQQQHRRVEQVDGKNDAPVHETDDENAKLKKRETNVPVVCLDRVSGIGF